MKCRYSISLAVLILAACSNETASVESSSEDEAEASASGENATNAPEIEQAANAGGSVSGTGDTGAPEDPYAEGRPGQPAIPETREDPNWQSRYSPDIPYYNTTDSAIPATTGASPRTGLVGQVQPGDGGYIQTCELNSTYCKITFGGEGEEGYVNMDLLVGRAE